ncbi:MAG: twin-arginine translocase TatA/TatE family subunit [Thermodesulfobacteriota bacterium]
MFGIGLPELILIMAVALIVVGPEKLPELAKGLAKQLVELKKAANVLKESLSEDEADNHSADTGLPEGFSRPEELAAKARQESESRDAALLQGVNPQVENKEEDEAIEDSSDGEGSGEEATGEADEETGADRE